jgi:hypothetical protein
VGTVKADRTDVPLARATAIIESHLRSIGRPGQVSQLPEHFHVNLQVDGSGAVTRVFFDQDLGKAGTQLEILMRTWRFEAWTVPGLTMLRVPLQVRR